MARYTAPWYVLSYGLLLLLLLMVRNKAENAVCSKSKFSHQPLICGRSIHLLYHEISKTEMLIEISFY